MHSPQFSSFAFLCNALGFLTISKWVFSGGYTVNIYRNNIPVNNISQFHGHLYLMCQTVRVLQNKISNAKLPVLLREQG